MPHEFTPGQKLLFVEPDFLSSIVTFIEVDEGWDHVQFSDHTPERPSVATVRPSRVFAIGDEALRKMEIELAMALARGDDWRIDSLVIIRDEIKRLIDEGVPA